MGADKAPSPAAAKRDVLLATVVRRPLRSRVEADDSGREVVRRLHLLHGDASERRLKDKQIRRDERQSVPPDRF